jgi:hypothetical protein
MSSEARAYLSKACITIENDVRPLLIKAIEASRNAMKTANKSLTDLEDEGLPSEDGEDALDILEKFSESSRASLRSQEEDLRKIDICIKKYKI